MGKSGAFVGCLVVALVCTVAGCKTRLNRSSDPGGVASTSEATAAAAVVAAKPSAAPGLDPKSRVPPRPAGPAFAIEPGQGIGPIRFGSTVATVERHMGSKCEELTDKYCRYITSGLELELANGGVTGMAVHRWSRPVEGSSDKIWGVFAGGLPPKVMLMMVPESVIEEIGAPKRTEDVTGDNPNWTVRRDYYDGLVLEYDKNRANDRLMLGKISVVKR